MKKVVLLALLVLVAMGACVGSSDFDFHESELETEEKVWALYERWSRHHNSSRSDEDKFRRFKVFKANARYVDSANRLDDKPYKVGLNEFSDMSTGEFNRVYANCISEHDYPPENNEKHTMVPEFILNTTSVPKSVDWRVEGAVLPVGNQKGCGCCWAFSAVDSIAAAHYLTTFTKDLYSLSVQQLVDCVFDSCGCKHGSIIDAFRFTMKNKGITTAENYPYIEKEGTCIKPEFYPVVTIDGYKLVPSNNEAALLHEVANQPVSASVDSSSDAFKTYAGGVFDGDCETNLNHQVTIVGYGTTPTGMEYWIVKNSWGETWGEQGYMRLKRGGGVREQGLCGIAMHPVFATKSWALHPMDN